MRILCIEPEAEVSVFSAPLHVKLVLRERLLSLLHLTQMGPDNAVELHLLANLHNCLSSKTILTAI